MARRTLTIALVITTTVAAAACGGSDSGYGDGEGSREGGTKGGGAVEVSLEEQEDSGITGDVTFEDEGDATMVKLSLDGADEDKSYAAHVHEGTCDELDPAPKYPLESATGGTSETSVDVAADELTDGEFAVNVHDADDPEKYVACGNIEG